ncbi:MAG: trimethylamine methyltransferase family protein [Thermodesulfobacteriota bacterium]|nr:trimethylamine methyltransferase family protein [Thermodesulfobacteriota bacterium]
MMKPVSGGQYKPLSGKDVKRIHEAALELLVDVGIKAGGEGMLKLFRYAGAKVDSEHNIVKIPYRTVQECLYSVPKEVVLYGREDKHNLYLSGKNVYMGSGGTAINVIDLDSNRRRKALLKDVRNLAKLIDNLDNIHFNLIPVYPNNIKAEEVDINRFYASILNTTKHIMGGIYTIEGLKKTIKMAELIAGSKEELRKRPFVSFIVCVMSPLVVDKFYGDVLIEIAKQKLPVAVPAEPLTGLTSPITLAGNLTGLHAETLAKIIIAQLVHPGTPTIYACTASTADPWSMRYLSGSVEMGLINAGAAQLAQYLDIPNYTTAGMTDSKAVDAQNGYEKALSSLLVALSGSNFIHDTAGLIEFAMTVSYKQYVIDNEINGMVLRAVKGIDVNAETIALDVFKKVGPGGNFINQKHTKKYLRKEHYIPHLSDRKPISEWEKDGSRDIEHRAIQSAKKILKEHEPLSIPSYLKNKIREKFPEVWD